MGLFREHFHWRALATLPIGVISLLLAIAGLLSRFTEQHVAAVCLFVLVMLGIIIRFVHAAVVSKHSKSNRITFSLVCSLAVVSVFGYLIAATWPEEPLPK